MRSRLASSRAQPRRQAVRRATAWVSAVASAALLALLAAPSLPRAEAAIAEISPTIYVGGIGDLRRDGGGASKCEQLVDAAAAYGMFQRVQILVSALWWDSGPSAPPPGWSGCKNYTLSTYYCFSRFNATEVQHWSYQRNPETGEAPAVTQGEVDEFTTLLATCFKHAVSKGLSPAINLHIDDGRASNGWRNTLAFDPLQKFQGFSYVDFFLNPIVDALNEALPSAGSSPGDGTAWISLQGEMGATVFFYPKQWTQVAGMVRDRLRPDLRGRVKLGLGINNSKLCGCVLIDIVDYDVYLSKFKPLWPSIKGWFDFEGIRQAFNAVDYVGISAYVPQDNVDFPPCDMERLMKKMDIEFGYYGLTLKELYDSGKEIHWIEWGIGGGISQNGDTPAKTAIEAARYPFWGVWGPYKPDKDPWKTPEVKAYMLHYINMTSAYLLQGGCDYRVSGVYLWSVGGSWDVIGLYDAGATSGGSFRVEEAVQEIRAHNAAVHSGAGGAASDGTRGGGASGGGAAAGGAPPVEGAGGP